MTNQPNNPNREGQQAGQAQPKRGAEQEMDEKQRKEQGAQNR